jgi:glycosyltransferase involved in cell wall biosynthesis
MTRVLYVITELDVGGAEQALCELACRLDRGRFAAEVACLTGEGPLAARLRDRDVPVHLLKACCRWDARALWRLRRLLRRADIVHSFLYHANLLTRFAAIGPGARVVISSARVAERSRPRRRWLECHTHRLVDVEVCVSTGVRDWLAEGGFPRDKLAVIPNGVDVERFAGRDPAFKARLGLAPATPLVTAIGRLHEQKGMTYFLRAAASLLHSVPSCRFLIVGQGPLEAALKAEAREFHLEERVTFLGFCDDVPAVLRASDVFVLPSLWEGMPNALLEAMAAAVPVVATRVEGVTEVVRDGATGFLVLPRDVPGLVSATLRLLGDPGRARAMGATAQQHVRTHYTLDIMARRHEELYRRLLTR